MPVDYCCGIGAKARLAVGPKGGTITRMDFIDFKPTRIIKSMSDLAAENTIRGELDPLDTDVGEGILFIFFRTRFYLTSAKMAVLLPLLGFTNSGGDTWVLGDALDQSTLILGPGGSHEHTYDGIVPTDFVVAGQKGADPIIIDVGWIGRTFTPNPAGTFFVSQTNPAMTEGYIYPFGTGVNNVTGLTILNGVTVKFPQFHLSHNYHIVHEYLNSVNLTNACPTRHDLRFATSELFSTCDGTEAPFESAMAGSITGGALVLDFQTSLGSGQETKFTVANAKFIARPPLIRKPDFQRLPVNMKGYRTASTQMLTVLNKVNGV